MATQQEFRLRPAKRCIKRNILIEVECNVDELIRTYVGTFQIRIVVSGDAVITVSHSSRRSG